MNVCSIILICYNYCLHTFILTPPHPPPHPTSPLPPIHTTHTHNTLPAHWFRSPQLKLRDPRELGVVKLPFGVINMEVNLPSRLCIASIHPKHPCFIPSPIPNIMLVSFEFRTPQKFEFCFAHPSQL